MTDQVPFGLPPVTLQRSGDTDDVVHRQKLVLVQLLLLRRVGRAGQLLGALDHRQSFAVLDECLLPGVGHALSGRPVGLTELSELHAHDDLPAEWR